MAVINQQLDPIAAGERKRIIIEGIEQVDLTEFDSVQFRFADWRGSELFCKDADEVSNDAAEVVLSGTDTAQFAGSDTVNLQVYVIDGDSNKTLLATAKIPIISIIPCE